MNYKPCNVFTLFFCIASLAMAQSFPQDTVVDAPQKQKILKQSLDNLNISGYIQAQYQYAETYASTKVGNLSNQKIDKHRFGIRRGRVKFDYSQQIGKAVFQMDITELGVDIKDAYAQINIPKVGWLGIRAGVFDRPFGYEISYSSSKRETPERSLITQTLFPNERDLGAMLIGKFAINHNNGFVKLEAGAFGGNGIKADFDNRKDFIVRGSILNNLNSSVIFSGGISAYIGSVYNARDTSFEMASGQFIESYTTRIGDYFQRIYLGLDAQIHFVWQAGSTTILAEYVCGQQPSTAYSSKSPNSGMPEPSMAFVRQFRGGYIYWIQRIKQSKHTWVLRYDFYDANTKISGNQIGIQGTNTSSTDLLYGAFGIGYIYALNANVKVMLGYDINMNEKTTMLKGFETDRKDNLLTVRLQYRF